MGRDQLHVHLKKSALSKLYDRYEEEVASDADFADVVAALQHYREPADPEERRDLTEKLQAADRDQLVHEATRLKELFAKKMQAHILSESAQTIMAYLLGRIHSLFRAHVLPLIISGAQTADIDSTTMQNVLLPVTEELGENALHFTPQEIEGMYYFLAGNCYIDWES